MVEESLRRKGRGNTGERWSGKVIVLLYEIQPENLKVKHNWGVKGGGYRDKTVMDNTWFVTTDVYDRHDRDEGRGRAGRG